MSGFAIGASEGDADDTDEAPARFTLRVYVHGARGLAATGKVLPCNAYAEVSYGRQYVGRTRSSGGTQPRWAASLAVTLAAPPAASPRRAVSVDVYDHVPGMNRHCDTFLGRANIEAASLDAPLGTAPRRWHALVGGPPSKGRGKSGEVDCEVRFEGCGESCAEAEQAPPGVLLRVNLTIVRARGLVCKDYCGTSDPYVIVTGAKGFFAYGKTKTLFMTLKPEWHETFAIRPREDSMGTVAMPSDIFLRIMDYDALTRDDAMGGLELDVDYEFRHSTSLQSRRWHHVCSNSDCLDAAGEVLVDLRFVVEPTPKTAASEIQKKIRSKLLAAKLLAAK
ncbi:C2 domain-containing protein [Pelagophyceae sp. CCMP2097]|nr:C2 domain-containing protein [Pelagophyceae sp. CCMP2097]|mmetsp:Transcript_32261/g.108657  ORF Transcript_32261/g.108657 Transcript_32261/m.108657 type:complete len:336 (-) Transcript_32261:1754-2761(-)